MTKNDVSDFVFYTMWAEKISKRLKALQEEIKTLREKADGADDLIKIGYLECRRDYAIIQLDDALESAKRHKDDGAVRVKLK